MFFFERCDLFVTRLRPWGSMLKWGLGECRLGDAKEHEGSMLNSGLRFAIVIGCGVVTMGHAHAASWLEKNFWLSGPRYDRIMPTCDYSPALDRIIANFHTKEVRFWHSELRIVGIENIRETAKLPWAAQSIPRRFCSGTALINDRSRHAIYYSIAEDTGIIGMSWGVSFCVIGLDRNWAYNPACRAAAP